MCRLFHQHWLFSHLKLPPSIVAIPKEWASSTCTFSLYVSQPFVLCAILINAYTGLVASQGTLFVAAVVQPKDVLERSLSLSSLQPPNQLTASHAFPCLSIKSLCVHSLQQLLLYNAQPPPYIHIVRI